VEEIFDNLPKLFGVIETRPRHHERVEIKRSVAKFRAT